MERYSPLMWLVSTEFLADEDAARRMRCFWEPPWRLRSKPQFTYTLLVAASAFRRWHCVGVVLLKLNSGWPGDLRFECFRSPDSVLCRAILDAVHGGPGCADGPIIRKLLWTGARTREHFRGFGNDVPNRGPFWGGWFGWEPFRLAFVEQQQDRDQRETDSCKDMRDSILQCLSISDQSALDFLVGEHSKALYRASKQRFLKRLADLRERGKGAPSISI